MLTGRGGFSAFHQMLRYENLWQIHRGHKITIVYLYVIIRILVRESEQKQRLQLFKKNMTTYSYCVSFKLDLRYSLNL